MNKRMRDIVNLKDESTYIYDAMRFARDTKYEDFHAAHLMNEQLSKLYWEEIVENDYKLIKLKKRYSVKPGQTIELETNINDLFEPLNPVDFTSKGIVSSYGFLSFRLETTMDGYKIYVTNTLPKRVYTNYIKEKNAYVLEDATTTRYTDAGVYLLDKDNIIGIAGIDNEKLPELKEDIKKYLKK